MGKAFAELTTTEELIDYLDSAGERLGNSPYVHHYTTVQSAEKIIESKRLLLCNAFDMNDKIELRYGNPERRGNIFFASFMREDKESIGMWSMYAQPWKNGVKISIPKETFKEWIKGIEVIHEISKDNNNEPTGQFIMKDADCGSDVYISTVVYSDADSLEDGPASEEKLLCGTVENKHIKGATCNAELTGYVKDMAWSYEKEVRVKAIFDNAQGFQRAAIDIPDDVFNNMIITPSPLFEGDLKEKLNLEKLPYRIKTVTSLYKGRLVIKDPCKECLDKKPEKASEQATEASNLTATPEAAREAVLSAS